MEEIWVYRSPWKMVLTILGSTLFVVSSILMLIKGKGVVMAWLGIVFFGGGALFMLYMLLKQLITRRPYLIIGEKSLLVFENKEYEVRFADVEDFYLSGNDHNINIRYKSQVEESKWEEAGTMERVARKINKKLSGCQESVTASGLTIKPKVLCGILNDRLQQIEKA